MTIGREATTTVKFVDEYCEQYRDLFTDVRSFEYFKELHIGLMSELPRKSLPAIAKLVGESDSQGLHHFVVEGNWRVEMLRERRLALLKKRWLDACSPCVSMRRVTEKRRDNGLCRATVPWQAGQS